MVISDDFAQETLVCTCPLTMREEHFPQVGILRQQMISSLFLIVLICFMDLAKFYQMMFEMLNSAGVWPRTELQNCSGMKFTGA